MCAQKSILTFFKQIPVKRNPLSELPNSPCKRLKSGIDRKSSDTDNKEVVNETDDTNTEQRRELKCDSSTKNAEHNQSGSAVLTGEYVGPQLREWEKNKIEHKRLLAKRKLLSKSLSVLDPNMSLSWFAAMEQEFSKPYFKELNNFIDTERKGKTIYPPADKVWTFTKFCELDEIKVVIIGQDPYHKYGQAHGLCFSVPVGVALPPSLVNIFKELTKNFRDFELPDHGYLMGWAMQGVLLLNTVLTVQEQKANSHKDRGWEKLTNALLKYISDKLEGVVFMLWGNYAHKVADHINTSKHHVLRAGHPSPLSARLFFGCNHFLLCNELLKKQNRTEIKWNHLPSGVKPGLKITF